MECIRKCWSRRRLGYIKGNYIGKGVAWIISYCNGGYCDQYYYGIGFPFLCDGINFTICYRGIGSNTAGICFLPICSENQIGVYGL